ncbi:hypothetical protein MJO29_016704 [Puccinia striiformis f. sp. tritici]|nr:hypothetical protein MJO29_016704 [Puccinia striiformis f. sp. tritici]
MYRKAKAKRKQGESRAPKSCLPFNKSPVISFATSLPDPQPLVLNCSLTITRLSNQYKVSVSQKTSYPIYFYLIIQKAAKTLLFSVKVKNSISNRIE